MTHAIGIFRSSVIPLILTAQLNFKTLNPSVTKDLTIDLINTTYIYDIGCTTYITYINTINDIAYIFYKSYVVAIRCINCIK
jgi:hypothetical protein